MNKKRQRFAVMFGNRGFFPGELVASARDEMTKAILQAGYEPVLMDESLTRFGAVETLEEAKIFREFLLAAGVDGLVISLPNFSDESAAAYVCRDLDIPILIQAYPDTAGEMDPAHRRDAFCGKLSMTDVIYQCRIPFTVYPPHVVHPLDERFTVQLHEFAGVCRIVGGLRRCRLGAIGARTSAFKTVRYDELALEKHGISVETVDLSELIARVKDLDAEDPGVHAKLQEIREVTDCTDVPESSLIQMGRLAVVLDEYIEELDLDMMAIRCWGELEQQLGCAPCTVMALLGQQGFPVACELDVCNAVMMYALSLASDGTSTLMDWNNNFGDEDDACILFHCGPVPESMLSGDSHMIEHPMFAKSYGSGCGWGPIESRLRPGDVTYASAKTEDGKFCVYAGDARIRDEKLEDAFFGTYGVIEIDNLQEKLLYLGKHAYRHHVAICDSHVARVLKEAFTTYLGYDLADLP